MYRGLYVGVVVCCLLLVSPFVTLKSFKFDIGWSVGLFVCLYTCVLVCSRSQVEFSFFPIILPVVRTEKY